MSRIKGLLLVMAALCSAAALAAENTAPKPYQLQGQWIEACACGIPCGCVFTGKPESGCQGMGVLSVRSGRYGNVDLAGARMAAGLQPGDWMIVYFDPSTTPEQREALQAIMAPIAQQLGVKVEEVKTAPVTVSGSNGRFTASVPDVMTLQTEPVLGLDKVHPIQFHNVPDPLIRDGYQGRAVSGSYKDRGHEFKLEGTNAFWSNVRLKG